MPGLFGSTIPPPDHPLTHSASSQPHRAESSNMRSEPNSAAHRGEAGNLPAVSGEQQGKKSLAQARKLNRSELAGSRELTTGSTATTKELARRRNATVPSEQTQGKPMSGQGCTPIGLTAQGDLVFPMACREQVELRGRPPNNQSGSTQRADKTRQRVKIPAQRRAEAITERPASISAPDVSGRTGAATGKVQSKSDERMAIGRNRHPMRKALRSTRTTNAPSKRERPPPLGRSGTVVSRSNEWFNPLGLR
jgi:hypothetical protein